MSDPERCAKCIDPRDQCSYCGCCQHTQLSDWCKVDDAPYGMRCPRSDCGCEGRS